MKTLIVLIAPIAATSAIAALQAPPTFSSINSNLIITASATTNNSSLTTNYDFEVNPNITGPWVRSLNGNSTNQFLLDSEYATTITNYPFEPTNGIDISGSTNFWVNGHYALGSSQTNGGLVYFVWTNTVAAQPSNFDHVDVTSITISGSQNVFNDTYTNVPQSGTVEYNDGGTNFVAWRQYNGESSFGSSILFGNLGVASSPPVTILWTLYPCYQNFNGYGLSVIPVAGTTNLMLSRTGWGNSWDYIFGITLTSFTNAGAIITTTLSSHTTNNIVYFLYTITNQPASFPTPSGLLLSGPMSQFTKDNPIDDPNGHWTQIIGSGDSAVTGSASLSASTSLALDWLSVPHFNASSYTLANQTIYHWSDLTTILPQPVQQVINNFSTTNTGLTVTNWTPWGMNGTNYITNAWNSISWNTFYTNTGSAALLSALVGTFQSNSTSFSISILRGTTVWSYPYYTPYSTTYHTNFYSNPITVTGIPINNGDAFSFTSNFTNDFSIISIDLNQLPH